MQAKGPLCTQIFEPKSIARVPGEFSEEEYLQPKETGMSTVSLVKFNGYFVQTLEPYRAGNDVEGAHLLRTLGVEAFGR